MEKIDIKTKLESMITEDNKYAVEQLLESLNKMNEEELRVILEQSKISDDNIDGFLNNLLKQQQESSEKFTNVNEYFCYGKTGNTIHMHLIPKNLRDEKERLGTEGFKEKFHDQLKDFLYQMYGVFNLPENENVTTLFAVSPIFYHEYISDIHTNLGFDTVTKIDKDNKNDRMSDENKKKFLDMFKPKEVYYTQMTRKKLLENYKPAKENERNHQEELNKMMKESETTVISDSHNITK